MEMSLWSMRLRALLKGKSKSLERRNMIQKFGDCRHFCRISSLRRSIRRSRSDGCVDRARPWSRQSAALPFAEQLVRHEPPPTRHVFTLPATDSRRAEPREHSNVALHRAERNAQRARGFLARELGSRGRTRTAGLQVMSLTSCQLLHPAKHPDHHEARRHLSRCVRDAAPCAPFVVTARDHTGVARCC